MQKNNIQSFIDRWTGIGDEKGQSQTFWIELLHDVLNVERPTELLTFENRVKLSHTSFIDAYIDKTKVLIEQKSIDKDLRTPIKQSDGSFLTPFQQAKRYAHELPYSKQPRWVVTCNFKSFLIYDMERPQGEPFEILLENLAKEAHLLNFLVKTENENMLTHEMRVSIDAGKLVGKLYDAFLAQYGGNANEEDLHSLNVLCVRLVFCLYAEDAGVFARNQFVNYLRSFHPENMRMALRELFTVLDTPKEKRDRFMADKLKAFPYVNGSLFRMQPGEDIPPLTNETAELLINKASYDFNWSEISPTIFGAVFESTINPETRRSGGMHYTSIENIHKVIDPLFLDDLTEEFETLEKQPSGKQKEQRLTAFQDKLASLKFLDPACGSGNFLTETYVSLRRLENRVIECITGGQSILGFEEVNPIKVNIHQFYGIEINDFAVTVATSALWIAESQMMEETARIIRFNNDYLPLKSYSNIKEGNALRIDWKDVVDPSELNYIIGNPPFVGARMMEQGGSQKKDIEELFGCIKDVQDLDYVCGWYKKAAMIMENTKIQAGLVSTNSICQGSQVPILWDVLLNQHKVHINYAWPTFKWNSESTDKAAVHCIIVGFGYENRPNKKIFTDIEVFKNVDNISPYLTEGTDLFVTARNEVLCDVPKMNFGNQPRDGGYFILKEDEREELLKQEPSLDKWIRPYVGADEFIKGKKRYCLWLKQATPYDIKQSKILYDRVSCVRKFREESKAKTTNGYAKVPHLFAQLTQPDDVDYILLPRVSSERRRYVPMGFLSGYYISSDAVQIIPNASLYHFGILTSSVHMAWMRSVCGRLKSDYRYSKDIVYNNFPWPTPTEAQKAKIEATAQAILDARALYPDSSLADLYDEVTMPTELRRAHQQNDRAVMEAYGFPIKDFTESDCVAALFKLYKELVSRAGKV
ncbi:MAG: methylase [Bacteroidales bacterium]|nr:methylase [Bacteroidales bacterium]